MPYISQSSIQELSDRMDALAVASDYVQISKKGGRFWAKCPFHSEKTASFTVNPELKTYYCFGCHKGGTIVNFVMEMDKITYPEAIELLAKRFSIQLVYEDSMDRGSKGDEDKKKEKDELFELYRRLAKTFHHFLQKMDDSEEGKHYIISRGIKIEMIERFGLGFAPVDRFWLHKFLINKGYSREFLSASGLFSSRNPETSLFSNRLMFPINDRQGRVVAFGGRIIPGESREGWDPPKYINSPELGIYKKGETLFAIDLALSEIRRTKTVYIAEGYLDVIALHQAGVVNAVAPLGTAFTNEQARLLKRWAERVIFFFDSDEAGREAQNKGILTCRREGIACSIVVTDETDDPAGILKEKGPGELQKIAMNHVNDFDYLLNRAKNFAIKMEGKNAEGRAEAKVRALESLFPYIEILESDVARTACMEAAADGLGLLPANAVKDYERYLQKKITGIQGKREEAKANVKITLSDELTLFIVLALDFVAPGEDKLFLKYRPLLEISGIDDINAKEIFIALEECIRYGLKGMDDFLERLGNAALGDFIIRKSLTGEFTVNASRLAALGLKKIREKGLEQRREEILVELRSADTDNDMVRELLTEKMQIDREIQQLTKGR